MLYNAGELKTLIRLCVTPSEAIEKTNRNRENH